MLNDAHTLYLYTNNSLRYLSTYHIGKCCILIDRLLLLNDILLRGGIRMYIRTYVRIRLAIDSCDFRRPARYNDTDLFLVVVISQNINFIGVHPRELQCTLSTTSILTVPQLWILVAGFHISITCITSLYCSASSDVLLCDLVICVTEGNTCMNARRMRYG